MPLTNDDINKLATLARLKLDDTEQECLLADLNNIFKMIQIMQEVDTQNIEPISHPNAIFQRLRDDIVIKTEHLDKYLKIAPIVQEGFYLVPKVIEENN